MNRTDAPKKQPIAFGVNGPREDLPDTTPSGDNTASYNTGFPPITMTLKSAGGLPPKGQDMNQILYELSNLARWASSGALNSFDATFATSIGGYPSGALVISDDLTKIYASIADANTNNPNSSTTGWKDLISYLGLSDIATAGVGTGVLSASGRATFPLIIGEVKQNLIIQWGNITTTAGSGPITFPLAFPTALLASYACEYNSSIWKPGSDAGCAVYGIDTKSRTGMRIASLTYSGGTWSNFNAQCQWLAIGY